MRITPEVCLLWAVLERGIIDFTGKVGSIGTEDKNYWERNAKAWVLSNATDPFSFNWICDELGLIAKQVRRQIIRMRPEFEPACRSAIRQVLNQEATVLYEVEKEHRTNDPKEVELERKRA